METTTSKSGIGVDVNVNIDWKSAGIIALAVFVALLAALVISKHL